MKFKVFLKTFIVLLLFSSNIFLFNKLKSKQDIINNSNNSEEQKQTDEEKKKSEDNKDKKNEDRVENIRKYIEDKNISTVSLSGFRPKLKSFLKEYMMKKYNYNSLADDRKLENYYTDDLKNEYLEKNKGKEAHPKYDYTSSLIEDINFNINTLDEKTFMVTTLHKRHIEFVNKGNGTKTVENKNCIYSDTYIIIIEDNKYKIQKEEEVIIKDLRKGA